MDNASKALVIAGGLLIAMAVITTALYAYSKAQGFADSSNQILTTSQIQSFNRFYTAFGDGTVTSVKCIDAINILNRAIDDEIEFSENSAKINFVEADGKRTYVVDGDHSEYYVQAVNYSFERDVQGKVNKVIIVD